jgi:hypothetical protein
MLTDQLTKINNEAKTMLTKEYTDRYKISTKKAGKKPKDSEKWKKEKEKTDQRRKQPQPDPPKEKSQMK